MEQCKYPRCKEIFEEYKRRLNCPDISEDKRAYYSDIINAVDVFSYDVPIPMQKMYEALEKAERQWKHIQIVPNDEFFGWGRKSGTM